MIDRIPGLEGGGVPDPQQLKEQALEMAASLRERAERGGELVRQYTIHQPARALAVALGMGVLLGWMVKRR